MSAEKEKVACCLECRAEIAAPPTKCEVCGTIHGARQCVICAAHIPRYARRCNECDAYQDWRHFFPFSSTVLALMTALIAVLTPAVTGYFTLFPRHSSTKVSYGGGDSAFIYVYAWNRGRRPAVIEQYALTLPGIEPLELEPSDRKFNIVAPDSPSAIRLTVTQATPMIKVGEVRYTKEEIRKLVEANGAKLELVVTVQESSGERNAESLQLPLPAVLEIVDKRVNPTNEVPPNGP
jgi:hypothetical protein